MGDLTFFVPPGEPSTTTPASAAAPEPATAGGAAASPSVPRLRRRVHFCDLVPSPHIWLPPASAAATATPEADPPPKSEKEETAADEPAMDEDKMDLLWEDFNEELLALRRAGLHHRDLESSTSDGEDSADSAAGRAPAGCFPVLRPAARAGLAGHYRRRAGTWVLLMRIFRRLFVIDKTITSSSSAGRHATASSSSKR